MRKQIFAVVILCCLSLFAAAQKYRPDYQDGALWLKLKPSEELLTKKGEKPSIDGIRVLKPLKEKYKLKDVEKPFKKIRKASPLQDTYLLTFDQIQETDKLIKELEKSGVLEYAEKVPLNRTAVIPNDYTESTLEHLKRINAQGAWDLHTAAGNTVIAIVDDAVMTTHPDLAPNIWQNPGEILGNNIDDDHNDLIDDVNGWDFAGRDNNPNPESLSFAHGTHVAGIASAATNNGIGIASIGFGAKLMCIKAASQAGIIAYGYSGIMYAADMGADVINLSWGNPNPSITGQNIINYALERGCIIVAAAGNNNKQELYYPASYPGVISVAATDNNDVKASFSNYGSAVTVSAPGLSIYSTTVDGSYGYNSGTSMASPLVAGLVALMHSYNPSMPNADLVNCLKSTATNINASNPSYAGKLGVGRIDAAAAMLCVKSTLSYLPTAGFTTSQTNIRAGNSITFKNTSSYASSWVWSFPGGSPSSSTSEHPTVTYNTPGTYSVTLTASNTKGSDIETKPGYIIVGDASVCYALNSSKPGKSWSGVYFPFDDGYVNGLNSYGQKQNAMYFDASANPSTHITSVRVTFSHAFSSDKSKIISAKVYDGTMGSPGPLLGSTDLTIGSIMEDVSSGYSTRFDFLSAVELPASKKFFLSVDYSSLCFTCTPGDTLSIVSNDDGETVPSATWEQSSDGVWRQYNTPGSWPLDISLYIFPFITNYPPVATFIGPLSDVCIGNSVQFDASGSTYEGGFEWTFLRSNGRRETIYNNPKPLALFDTSGTHQVILGVQGGGCNDVRYTSISFNVNDYVTPSVSLSSNTSVPNVPVTFTATASHGGSNPVFDFKKNGVVMQTGTSNTWTSASLASGDEVSVQITSNQSCVTSSLANSNAIVIDAISMAALPVELLYFKGSSASGTNHLQWATASEINTDKFIVERSVDGALYAAIGTVKAKGESYTTITYQFKDTRPASAFYRLRMLDKDGSFKFSQVIYLAGNKEASLMLWPNPATVGQDVQLVFSGRNTKQELVQVSDSYGKVIFKKTVALKGGRLETGIPTQHLAAGLYFVTITDQTTGRVQKEKIMIVK